MADWACEKWGRQFTDEFARVRATRLFHVHMDAPTYNFDEVLSYAGLPVLGVEYSPAQADLRCSSREVREVDGRSLHEFEVTIQYETTPYLVWDVKLSTQTVDQVLEQTMYRTTGVGVPARFPASPAKYLYSKPSGLAGEVISNRAGEPFDPPTMTTRRQTIISASIVAESIVDLGFASVNDLVAFTDTVNDDRLLIFGIPSPVMMGDYWSFLMDDVTITKLPKIGGGCDIRVDLRIVYDPLGHCQVVLNAGYNERVPDGGVDKRRKCRDNGQTEVSAPVPLDANGIMVPPATLPGAATYIVFPDHNAVAFSALKLPTTLCGSAAPTPP